jgi:hypothetical protein
LSARLLPSVGGFQHASGFAFAFSTLRAFIKALAFRLLCRSVPTRPRLTRGSDELRPPDLKALEEGVLKGAKRRAESGAFSRSVLLLTVLVFGLQLFAGLLGALLRWRLHLRGEGYHDGDNHQPEEGDPAR